MRNLQLVISYDGSDFSGWQRQAGRRTVQGVLEEAVAKLAGAPVTINASGRTDAGVHAIGQSVNFRTESRHPPATFVKALNAMLERDVRIRSARERHEDFHATLDAVGKLYRYEIDNARIADVFRLRYAYHVYHRIDLDRMNAAAAALKGRHDFHSFETDWPNRKTSVRTITRIEATRRGDSVSLEVEADGFLYNMMRSIAGTLILVATGHRRVEWVAEALAAEDRSAAGPTAPPQGLFLVRVDYPEFPEA